jgi:hypothetical protein
MRTKLGPKAAVTAAWIAAGVAAPMATAAPLQPDASMPVFEEIIAMLDTAAISSDCTMSEVRVTGDTGARTLSYELKKGDVAMALTLREAARDDQWRVSRDLTGGVPYWRLAARRAGDGIASVEWTVRDTDLVSVALDVSAEDGRSLRCGMEAL